VTSLIYIAIIVLWIAVLIPMWLRRLDRVSEEKSTARFSSAMELLGSKVTAETAVTSGAAARDPKPPVTPRLAAERAKRAAEARAIASARRASIRRTVVLAILTTMLIVTLILALVRTVAQWVPVATAAMVIAFVVASALTASTRTEALAASRGETRPAKRDLREFREFREFRESIAQEEPVSRPVTRTTSSRAGSPRSATVALEVERKPIIAPPVMSPQGISRQTIDFARDDGRSDTEAIPIIDEAYYDKVRASNE
jgi:hypothetical protein